MKITFKKMITLAISAMCAVSYGGNMGVDYATEDAALKTIWELNQRSIKVGNIAFIGISGAGGKELAHVFRGGLLRTSGNYKFFTRDDKEFDILLSEIEFGVRKEDVMNQATIQKFGKIEGVDALLYGRLLGVEVDATSKKTYARLNLSLGDVETGQILWSGNITGDYQPAGAIESLPKELITAIEDAAQKTAKELAKAQIATQTNVYLLPVLGSNEAQAELVSDMVAAKLINVHPSLNFYSNPPAQNKELVKRLALKLNSGNGVGLQGGQMLQTQLDQVFVGTNSTTRATVSISHQENLSKSAYLTGKIVNTTIGKNSTDSSSITIMYKIQTLDNRTIWAATVTGDTAISATLDGFEAFYNKYKALCIGVLVVIGAIVGIFGMFVAFRILTGGVR